MQKKRKLDDAIEKITDWLDGNYMLPEPYKFEEKLNELKSICDPIFTTIVQQENDDDITGTN